MTDYFYQSFSSNKKYVLPVTFITILKVTKTLEVSIQGYNIVCPCMEVQTFDRSKDQSLTVCVSLVLHSNGTLIKDTVIAQLLKDTTVLNMRQLYKLAPVKRQSVKHYILGPVRLSLQIKDFIAVIQYLHLICKFVDVHICKKLWVHVENIIINHERFSNLDSSYFKQLI